jgi:glycosyltransferase involved in cell wall biosynthesis
VRIAFHSPRASHLRPGFSGDKVQVRLLLEGLRARRHEVLVVSRLNARDVWRGRVSGWQLLREAIAVRRRVRRFAPDAWLVYNPSRTNPDLFGWWQRPKRYVVMHADVGSGRRAGRRWRALYRFAHRRSLARASRVAACHPVGLDKLRPLVESERLALLPPTAPRWEELPSRDQARRLLGLPAEEPLVLCVSRFTLARESGRPAKTDMILELVRAVAELPPEVVLVVVGDGPGRGRVEKVVAALPRPERIRLFARVDDVLPFYAACDLFAYPHPDDRPWGVIVEAGACGRTVLTMRTRAAKVMVDHDRTGLLARDRSEFRAHLHTLTADLSRCREMGDAARLHVFANHSVEERVKQIEAFLSG